jgi:uncharacterized protein DUF1565
MTSWITLRARSQFGRTLLALLWIASIALVLAAHANAAATTINVNSGTGKDANSGSATSPLKTLTKALTLAGAGTTINLAGGDYSFGSGERFSPLDGASPQVVVPSGVTIQGNTGSGAATDLNGSANQIGLLLAGDATIRNVGLFGFGAAIKASQGTQNLTGIQVRGGKVGILLTGTANTTLSGAVHLSPNFPFAFGQTTFEDMPGATGVFVGDGARFTMTGGGFFGGDQAFAGSNPAPNCDITQDAIFATTSAQVNLHSVLIDNVAGGALTLQGDSIGSIDESTIESDYDTDQCVPPAALSTGDNANLSVTNSTIASNGVGSTRSTKGISALGAGELAVGFSSVDGFNDKGIVSGPLTNVAIHASKLADDGVVGLDTGATQDANVTVTNSTIEQCLIGVRAQTVLMQASTVTNNNVGVGILGPYADLGTLSNPGGNDFQGNSGTGVAAPDELGTSGVIDAVGNLWDGGVQGANPSGFYPNQVTFTGRDPEAAIFGQNFSLAEPGDSINLGPLVGLAKLTPTTIDAHAGKVAHLTLAWTSPVGWRQLRSIQLRLYRGARAVGAVTIAPLSARLSSTGAVTLMIGRSRLDHAGKTVTANLRLRFPEALAGLTLRLAVQATDIHGHRQLVPFAGTVRVSR